MHGAVKNIRMPTAAGRFYPADAVALRHAVSDALRAADVTGPYPKALIVPHAGYQYSGVVAASAYALLRPVQSIVKRVVIVGPSHHWPLYGLAASRDEEFETPLGLVPVDTQSVHSVLRLPQVHLTDEAHQDEYSLEVQLPFLQMTLREFSIVPLAVGQSNASEVADVFELLWDDAETLVVVSSDLSHFHDYATARGIDSETSHVIERCQARQLNADRACGYAAIGGLLKVAKRRELHVKTIALQNSGDTAGSKERVVGYGSFIVY